MKQLLLLRHAKSSWKDETLADHDRPLNKRGKHAAPRIGELLVSLGIAPDVILSSTALRARSTAEAVVEAAALDVEINYLEDLYHAGPQVIAEALMPHGTDADTILLVAHNPGLEMTVRWLAGADEVMPTGALVALEFDVEGWSEVVPGEGRVVGVWRVRDLEG